MSHWLIVNLLTITPFITLVVTFVSGAQVEFYVNRACDSSSQTFRGDCNFCADPPFGRSPLEYKRRYFGSVSFGVDWGAVQFSDISADTRVSIHNQDGCTGASQVGQGFGPACWLQGATKIRSAFVACPGSR